MTKIKIIKVIMVIKIKSKIKKYNYFKIELINSIFNIKFI